MRSSASAAALALLVVSAMVATPAEGANHNPVFSPCSDTTVQRKDGFTFGIAFAARQAFFDNNKVQLSPCDSRLSLSSSEDAQLVVFRPKIDEISLLTINASTSLSVKDGGYMVAFAGRKYAARSTPVFVGNSTYSVTSFTLVLEFKKGTLQNLYWKRDGCASCSGKSSTFVCMNDQVCAVKTSACESEGGTFDCNIGIQLAFSGTDKYDSVLNSWYEVSKLQQYSLYKLYSDVKDSLTGQYDD